MNFMNISVGEAIAGLAAILAGFVAFIKGIEFLGTKIEKTVTKWLERGLAPTNYKIDGLKKQLTEADISACKNFLVRFLADCEQGQRVDEVERERFYETYNHYCNDLKQNSYIHDKVEKLKEAGKL